jgi:hypothetical protein
MNAEVVISGLCSILNPFGKNTTMADPGVIVMTTNGHQHGPDHDHIGFLAFDATYIEFTGPLQAVSVPGTQYFYFPIDGWELKIEGLTPGKPKPDCDNTFRDLVAHRDEYWPEALDDFDRDVVPEPTKRPKKTGVKAWMLFGEGLLTASRVSKVPWRFTTSGGMTLQRNFAEEVVYRFTVSGDAVVIQLRDLEDEMKLGAKLTFKLKASSSGQPLTLMLGNSTQEVLLNTLDREVTQHIKHPYSTHFAFLNQTAKLKEGPIPVAINPKENGGGGGSGGVCGPGSGNGRP